MKTSHLKNIEPWKNFAAGTVGGVYPNPVEPDSILDLANFEQSEHKFNVVGVMLSNSFNSGYMGEKMEYVAAGVADEGEDDFSLCNSTLKQALIGRGLSNAFSEYKMQLKRTYMPETMQLKRTYMPETKHHVTGNSLCELLLNMAKAGYRGTVSFHFSNVYEEYLDAKIICVVL